MANKITKVKCAASSASEQTEEDPRVTVTRLRAELDAERKTTRQLRREKAVEVQRVREQEQTKASICLKDLTKKLQQERQQEVELQRETSRCKLDADYGKVIKMKDQEIKKLKQDLAKCQHELGEEVTKRGLSTSARGTFEAERNKLLQEVKELNASKKHLESALQAAGEAEKQKKLEFRQLQDSCKQELARVEKEASLEVKKLLEELKTKDNMLAMMDRNIYPDKAKMLKNQVENLSIEELLNLSREVEKMSKTFENSKVMDACVVSGGCVLQTIGLQKKLYELEKQVKFANGLHHAMIEKNTGLSSANKQLDAKVKLLTEQINNLNCELQMNKSEIGRLNDVIVSIKSDSDNQPDSKAELEHYKQLYVDVQSILASVRHDCQEKDRRIALLFKSQHKHKQKYEPKTVRFMLPDEDEKVTTEMPDQSADPETEFSFDFADEDNENRVSDEMLIQSVHKDYEQLMEEHLKLEKYCSTIIQTQPAVRELAQQSWMLEKESLNVALWALEDKLRQSDEREQILRCQLQDARDQNEELEFRILELEECTETTRSTYYQPEDVELMEKTRMLETQVLLLKQRLSQFEMIDIDQLEKDAEMLPGSFNGPITDLVEDFTGPHQRLSLENLRKLTASLSDSDDDNAMVQSFSTMTSGFDEISCISLDLDDKTDMLDISPIAEENLAAFEIDEATIPKLNENESEENDQEWNGPRMDNSEMVESMSEDVLEDLPLDDISELPLNDQHNIVSCDEFCLSQGTQFQRIKDLQDQVDILEYNDTRYSKTIDSLNEIEQQLQISVLEESKEMNDNVVSATKLRAGSDAEFWMTGNDQIAQDIGVIKMSLCELSKGILEDPSELERETRIALCKCSEKLRETDRMLNDQRLVSGLLDEKIQSLELHQNMSFESKDIAARLESVSESVKLARLDSDSRESPHFHDSDSKKVKSLKLCAMKAVVNEFKTDFKELKSLTNEFLHVIDGGSVASCTGETSISSTYQDKMLQLKAAKAELRLNTNLPFADQRFDFFSPTTFESEWAASSHLETINHCLLQQIQDLEKERDLLQELVYKDENVISEMSIRIGELNQSEKALQKIVERLEVAEEQTRAKVFIMESHCEKAKTELKRVESSEASLKLRLESLDTVEAELNMKLRNTFESLQSNEAKYKINMTELEREKLNLNQHVEDLSKRIKSLESKETALKQRVKSLESAEVGLHDKVGELEASLTSAYDDVTRTNRQKDCLAQRVDALEVENTDLKHENAELIETKNCHMTEIEKLAESERFLKEANRKMWLSLQVNLEEQGCEQGQRSKQHEKTTDGAVNETTLNKEPKQNIVEPTDQQSLLTSSHGLASQLSHPVIIFQNASTGLRKAIELLGEKYPHIQSEFLVTVIRSSEITPETFDTMQKFFTTMQIKSSHSLPISTHAQSTTSDSHPSAATRNRGSWDDGYASVDGAIRTQQVGTKSWEDPVQGEETFWATVEDAQDINDVRAADRSNYWSNLEDIMGINTSRLGMFIKFRDAETNTDTSNITDSFLTSPPQVSHRTPYSATSEPPPLPTSPPPIAEPSAFFPQSHHALHGHYGDNAESADEASEIQDEDDGAIIDDARLPSAYWLRDASQSGYPKRARSAGFSRKFLRHPELAKQLSGNVGTSMDSVTDSGLESLAEKMPRKKCEILEQGTQTESTTKADDTATILRLQLEQKDKNLIAKMNEVDRLTVEMRRWQQKAVEAAEEASRLSLLRGTPPDESHSGEETPSGDSKLFSSSKQTKKSRFEPYVSQIPVSVKQTVDHYKNIDLNSRSPRPAGISPTIQSSPRGRAMASSPTNQGSVHTSGSSLSKASKFPSLLPRPVGEKSSLSSTRPREDNVSQSDVALVGHRAESSLQAASTAAAAGQTAAVAGADVQADGAASLERMMPPADERSE